MNGLPAAGIGEEIEVNAAPPAGLWQRTRTLVGEKLSYALADQVVFSFGNMMVAALIARHCTTWQLGVYWLTQRALDVAVQLCNVFFWAPFVFNLPSKSAADQRRYLGSIAVHQVAFIAIAAAVMLGVEHWAATPSRGLYYGVFAPLVLTTGPILFREFTRRTYFAEMRFREAFWTDVATVALQVGGTFYLLRRHALTVPNALWILALGAGIVSLWWMVRDGRRLVLRFGAIIADLRLNLHLGRWFFGSNMVFTVSSQCNPWVLGAMMGAAPVGAYGICESVVNIPRVALTSMQNIMGPVMARAMNEGGKPSLRKLVAKLDRTLLWSSILFAVAIVTGGPFVARLIFHRFPEHGMTVLVLLAINFVAFAATLAQTYGLTVLDRAGFTFYANAFGLLAQVAVTVWFVRRLGLPGAAAAMFLGSVVVSVARLIYYRREVRA